MRLFIIPGHGAGDPGACGHGYQEAERVRALAKRIKQLGGDKVELADFNRNYYADGGINTMKVTKDTCVLELHMDSGPSSARGGHVIIKAGFAPDSYDKAIEKAIKKIFPGRSITMSKRDDLANPNRAAARGINYRLVENGFISNASDVAIFNSHIDELAKAYLSAFGIKAKSSSSSSSKTTASTKTDSKKKVDIDDLARRVIKGEFGNGDARKKALGSNYAAVQKRVNEMLR